MTSTTRRAGTPSSARSRPRTHLPRGDAASTTPSPSAQAVQALRRFRLIFNAVRTHFRQVEKQTGTGAAQLRALSILQGQPGLRLSELAEAMDIHQSTASNLLKTLQERELVTTRRDEEDRRALRLQLLPAGSEILQRMGEPYIGVLPKALARLPEPSLERLNAELDVLIQTMALDDSAALTPLADQL